uniref:RAP domain-containing protein n=1 Tax=Scylla olivacea TaxID=85551 RepID=A0A0P4WJ92_SCYOL
MRFSIAVNAMWVAGYGSRLAAATCIGTQHVAWVLRHQSGIYCLPHVASTSSSWLSDKKVTSFSRSAFTSFTNKIHKRHYAIGTDGDSDDDIMSDSEFENSVFFRRKMLEKDQLDSLRVNLYPGSNDDVIKKINEANSVQEVFDQIERCGDYPTAEHLSQAIVTLWDLQKVYGRYGYDCFMITKNEINQFLEQILNHPMFEKLSVCLEAVCEDLNNSSLSSMLLYLSKLGVNNHSPVMQKLTLVCMDRMDGFNLTALSRLSVYLRDQGVKAFFLQSKLLPLIASKLDDCLDTDEFHMVSICFNSTKRLITRPLLKKYLVLVQKKLNEGFFEICDPRITLKVIKLLDYPEFSSRHKLLQPLMLCLGKNFHSLSVVQVMDLSNYFHSSREPLDVFHKICQYSVNMISEAKISGGRPDILCLAPFTSLKMRNYFERLIVEQLDEKDFHEYIMVIFKALRYFKTSNPKLCDAFWIKSMKSVEEELKSIPHHFLGMKEMTRRKVYQRYMYFNNNLGGTYRNFALERTMSTLLMKDLETCCGFLPNKVASMAAFIIGYSSREGIPESVYEKVILCGPQFSIYDTMSISRGMQISLALNRKNLQRKLMQQITTICRMLDARTEEFLKMAKSLTEIINLTRGYLNRRGSPRTFTFDRIISAFSPHLDELNSRYIKEICLCLTTTLYLAPEILEAMSEYILKNKKYILTDTMEVVLTCFYCIGYTPKNVEQLLTICTNSFLQENHHMRGLSILQMCLAMNMYGYLPTEIIRSVFNLKFMDQLDEEIENCYSKATYPLRVRHMLMELNRAVCLDHPEENIPWFHEKYCEDFLETVPVPTSVFHSEVHQALAQLVGGPEVVRANVHTPYYYLLDFEFVLDGSSNPVPVKEYAPSTPRNSKSQKKIAVENKHGHRRVAVILRRENHYCTNSRQLLGRHQVECRHLELMGYTVVEVPHFIWYSMAHATQEDKMQYLKDQIFPAR